MARKKKPEEHENHERWLVSYADFITLLFAFFVVMYSMSSVNEGKYRVLSASMVAAFSPTTRSLTPIQVGELVRTPAPPFPLIMNVPQPINIVPLIANRNNQSSNIQVQASTSEKEIAMAEGSAQIGYIATEITEFFESLIVEEQIIVRKNPLWMEIEIKSNILFDSGSAELSVEAEQVFSRLGGLFSEYPNRIIVEGFTDNLPIQSPIYPSNWELSSARAAAVVRLLESYGVEPVRMSSVGYGEFKPSSDNDSEEGRANNRRVIVVVMANIERQGQDIEIPFADLQLFRERSKDYQ